MKIAFFEIEDWEILYIKARINTDINADKYGFDLFFSKEKLNKDNLPEKKDFDIISIFVGSKIDKETINAFPNLKLITTRSTGFDHIDLKSAKEKNIQVAYVPGYGDNTVAEFAFALILTLSRKIFEAYDRIKEKGLFNFDGLRGFDLKGKTIGIVGTGRIGKYMVKIANGFGMKVIAVDAKPDEKFAKEENFRYMPLEEVLANADIVSLHTPYSPSTHHLINADNINKIKKGAILINTSRGPLVETEAIVKALNDGILGGYGADVLEEEGVISDEKAFLLYGRPEEHDMRAILADHVLIDMPNVIITPHTAFNTTEALQRILNADIENIKSFLEKGAPTYSIDNST
ncbi:MAG: NAD(P)-dependent oxidoreductase [Patescibacteria group bacterium]